MRSHDDAERWRDAGLISDEQLEAIVAFEEREPPSGGALQDVLAYVGAVLVVVAGVVVAQAVWGDLGAGGQAALAAAATAVLTIAGLSLTRSAQASTIRVGHAAMLLGTLTLAITTGVVVDTLDLGVDIIAVASFGAATIYAVVLYLRYRSAAQHLAVVGSLTGLILALAYEPWNVGSSWAVGAILFVFGLGWTWFATEGHLPPRLVGEIAGLFVGGVGSVMAIGELGSTTASGLALMVVFMIVCGGLIWLGGKRNRVALIVYGIAGLLLYMPWFVTGLLGEGLGAPIALLLIGALLVTLAVRRDRLASRSDRH